MLRYEVLASVAALGQASAYGVAHHLGVDPEKARQVCQNARRSGDLAAVGWESVAGADRPAVVYELALDDAPLPPASRWHDALAWDLARA